MNSTILPADISALVSVGVDKWHTQASWPIGEEEFSALTKVVYQSYGELLDTLTPELQDIFLIDLRFVGFLLQFFHAAAVKEQSRNASVVVSYGDLARPFYEPDWTAHAIQYQTINIPLKRILFRFREVVRKYRFNRHIKPFQRSLVIFKKSECWSIGVFGNDKREYLGPSNVWVESPYLESFLANTSGSADHRTSELSAPVKQFFDNVCSRTPILADLELSLPEIAQAWTARLGDIYKQYLSVLKSKRIPGLMLVSGLGNPACRIMALAAKRKGAHVVAFSHGNDMGMIENIARPFLEYAVCNEFVLTSQKAVDFHTEQICQVNWRVCSETTFSSLETDKYQKYFQAHKRGKRAIKSVMLMGFPMHPQRYGYGTGEFFPFRLSAELDVARHLRAAGYRVLYKPHPETQEITSKIMKSRVDEILQAPFESVMERGDCFVFTYPLTTTFGAALATDTPMVMLDQENRPWNLAAYEKLRRRCVMVPMSLDKNCRISFSGTVLCDAIKQSPSYMDHSYLDDFMSPAA